MSEFIGLQSVSKINGYVVVNAASHEIEYEVERKYWNPWERKLLTKDSLDRPFHSENGFEWYFAILED